VSVQTSFGSFLATVVEAEVDTKGEVNIRRVTAALDTGIAVNPDTIEAQMQGGIIFGLTAALYGEVTIKNGRVQQSNFHDYRMLRIDQTPIFEVQPHTKRRGARRHRRDRHHRGCARTSQRNLRGARGIALRRMP